MPHRPDTDRRRFAAVEDLIDTARAAFVATDDELLALSTVEIALADMAADSSLFPTATFPAPTETGDRTYLLHQEPDGAFALYLSVGTPGATFGPHDHGGAWAAIAAVSGAEHHRLYVADDAGFRCVGEAVCEPGAPLSIASDGIHSIEPEGSPFVHLHLYALALEHQGERRRFDPITGEERRVRLDDFSWIEDRRSGPGRPLV